MTRAWTGEATSSHDVVATLGLVPARHGLARMSPVTWLAAAAVVSGWVVMSVVARGEDMKACALAVLRR